MSDLTALRAEWTEMARELGRQHASGMGSDDRPEDAIDLNAAGSISMGELIDLQAECVAAYREGKVEAGGDEYPTTYRWTVTIDAWADESEREPTSEDVFLAVQDAVGPDGRLEGCAVEGITVEAIA